MAAAPPAASAAAPAAPAANPVPTRGGLRIASWNMAEKAIDQWTDVPGTSGSEVISLIQRNNLNVLALQEHNDLYTVTEAAPTSVKNFLECVGAAAGCPGLKQAEGVVTKPDGTGFDARLEHYVWNPSAAGRLAGRGPYHVYVLEGFSGDRSRVLITDEKPSAVEVRPATTPDNPLDEIAKVNASYVHYWAIEDGRSPLSKPGGEKAKEELDKTLAPIMTAEKKRGRGGATRRTPAQAAELAAALRKAFPDPVQAQELYRRTKGYVRPALGVKVKGVWVYNIHADSPGGPDAPDLVDAIDRARGTNESWAVVGDFNRTPMKLRAGLTTSVGDAFIDSGLPTHHQKKKSRATGAGAAPAAGTAAGGAQDVDHNYDYMVARNMPGYEAIRLQNNASGARFKSDHDPVGFGLVDDLKDFEDKDPACDGTVPATPPVTVPVSVPLTAPTAAATALPRAATVRTAAMAAPVAAVAAVVAVDDSDTAAPPIRRVGPKDGTASVLVPALESAQALTADANAAGGGPAPSVRPYVADGSNGRQWVTRDKGDGTWAIESRPGDGTVGNLVLDRDPAGRGVRLSPPQPAPSGGTAGAADDQRWKFTPLRTAGAYRITSAASGECLTALDQAPWLALGGCDGSKGQTWLLLRPDNGDDDESFDIPRDVGWPDNMTDFQQGDDAPSVEEPEPAQACPHDPNGPGSKPGTDPGTKPGTGPGTDPGTNPGGGPNPGTDPGTGPSDNGRPTPSLPGISLPGFPWLPLFPWIFGPPGGPGGPGGPNGSSGSGSDPATGTYLQPATGDALVPDVRGGIATAGNVVQAHEPNSTDSQKWVFWDRGNGNWAIETRLTYNRAAAADRLLLAHDTGRHESVLAPAADGQSAQLWQFKDAGGGWANVVSAAGGCLTERGAREVLAVRDCDGSAQQKWKLSGIAPKPDPGNGPGGGGTGGTGTGSGSGSTGDTGSTGGGTAGGQPPLGSGGAQPAPGRTAVLQSGNNGMVADLDGALTASGTRIKAQSRNGNDAQKWTLRQKPNGLWLIETRLGGAMVMDHNPNTHRTHLIATQEGNANQLWRFVDAGSGWYTVVSTAGNGCLTATADGEDLAVRGCDATNAQKWRLTETSDSQPPTDPGSGGPGTVPPDADRQPAPQPGPQPGTGAVVSPGITPSQVATLRSANNAMVADLDGANTAPGTSIKALGANGNDAQRWAFWPTADGRWIIETLLTDGKTAAGQGMVLDHNPSTHRAHLIRTQDGNTNQHWAFRDAGGGWYWITSDTGNGCLTADNAGEQLAISACTGSDRQRWRLDDIRNGPTTGGNNGGGSGGTGTWQPGTTGGDGLTSGGGSNSGGSPGMGHDLGSGANPQEPGGDMPDHGRTSVLQSANGGLVADLNGANTASGTGIKAFGRNGNAAQRWTLWEKASHQWLIETRLGGGMVIDHNPSTHRAHLIKAQDGNANQLWQFTNTGTGWYRIVSTADGGCLTAVNSNEDLAIWRCDNTPNQLWKLTNTSHDVDNGNGLTSGGGSNSGGSPGMGHDLGSGANPQEPGGDMPDHGRTSVLQSANGGLVADLNGANTASGTGIKALGRNGNAAQRWTLWEKASHQWLIETRLGGGMVIDHNPSTHRAHLTKAQDGNTNQLWQFTNTGTGWYRIVSTADGGCLTAVNSNEDLAIWRCDNTPNQLWKLTNTSHDVDNGNGLTSGGGSNNGGSPGMGHDLGSGSNNNGGSPGMGHDLGSGSNNNGAPGFGTPPTGDPGGFGPPSSGSAWGGSNNSGGGLVLDPWSRPGGRVVP